MDYYTIQNGGKSIRKESRTIWPSLTIATEDEQNARGAYRYAANKPEPPEGQQVSSTTYALNENAKVINAVYTYEDIPAVVRTFSTMKLYIALANIGLWDKFTEWLKSQTIGNVNLYTAFDRANDLVEDHPMFKPYVTMVQTALGVDDETLEKILSESVAE